MPPVARATLRPWLACMLLLLAACREAEPVPENRVIGGDAERGRATVAAVGCGVCHTIPGVVGARGSVGPSLDGFGNRTYIAGQLANRPETLVSWLRNPPLLIPETAMPAIGLSVEEARDVASFLYAVR